MTRLLAGLSSDCWPGSSSHVDTSAVSAAFETGSSDLGRTSGGLAVDEDRPRAAMAVGSDRAGPGTKAGSDLEGPGTEAGFGLEGPGTDAAGSTGADVLR